MEHTHRFAHRVVIVTGASTGIGVATTRAFARAGARLVLAARNRDRLRQAAAEFTPDSVLAVPCDVSKRSEVDDLMAQTRDRFGRIDVLVNNAGSGILGPFETVQLADAITLFDTNFFGTLNCCQAVLPDMKRQGGGHIINMSSLAGLRGIPNTIYSASKAAIVALSDSLRIELKPHRICVTVLCPGRVRLSDTAFFDAAKKYGPVDLYESPADLTADDVARVLLDAISKRRRMVVFPFHARLLHAINTFAPRWADRILYKHLPQTHKG